MLNDIDPPAGALDNCTIVLFNGPPHCGKDEAGKTLRPLYLGDGLVIKFAATVKQSTHVDFGLPDDLPDFAFEDCKDEPHPAFFGMSPRQAYIQKSEERQKPFLGKDIYGRIAVRRMWQAYQRGIRKFFFTDSGFAEEAVPVLQVVPHNQVLLVRIHRPGCTFKGDSRSYIQLPGIKSYDLQNDGSITQYRNGVISCVTPFVDVGAYMKIGGYPISCSELAP